MIVTVTLNPALDLTYEVDALVPHGTHRVATVAERAGGKGLNVARVLHTLGEPVLATGLLGGPTGARISEQLAAEGVAGSFVPITGETRRTVAVVDTSDATGFWEPGPTIAAAEWCRFIGHFQDLMRTARVVALSGSLPPGLPSDAYGILVRIAAAAGVPAVLDASGEALRNGLTANPAMAKPNADELAALSTDGTPAALRALTRGAVVVSRGSDGLQAVTPDAIYQCAPRTALSGNPTGAGDACVAALARGLRDGTPWPPLLADAVALSAAAVAAPVAGAFDPVTYRRLLADSLPTTTATPAASLRGSDSKDSGGNGSGSAGAGDGDGGTEPAEMRKPRGGAATTPEGTKGRSARDVSQRADATDFRLPPRDNQDDVKRSYLC